MVFSGSNELSLQSILGCDHDLDTLLESSIFRASQHHPVTTFISHSYGASVPLLRLLAISDPVLPTPGKKENDLCSWKLWQRGRQYESHMTAKTLPGTIALHCSTEATDKEEYLEGHEYTHENSEIE